MQRLRSISTYERQKKKKKKKQPPVAKNEKNGGFASRAVAMQREVGMDQESAINKRRDAGSRHGGTRRKSRIN